MKAEWKNTDPRHDIYKRANIIIIRPSSLGGGHKEAALGHVETKNVYCVFTDFKDGTTHIGEESDWDEAWLWTRTP
jgi:hypothetical protein